MKQLTNHHTQPIVLASGVILAAAGTKGSVKQVESIDESDRRRYVDRGLIVVSDVDVEPTADRRPSSVTDNTAAAPAVDRRPSAVAEKPAAAPKQEKESK